MTMPLLRDQLLVAPNFGESLAQYFWLVHRRVLTAAMPKETRRYRWPLLDSIEFEPFVDPNGFVVVVMRDRPQGPMVGPGIVKQIDEDVAPTLVPEEWHSWHESMTRKFRVSECDGLYGAQPRVVSDDIGTIAASWYQPDRLLIVSQAQSNLDRHRRVLGLPRMTWVPGPKEPGPASLEGKALALLRLNAGKFVKNPVVLKTRVVSRLRRNGFTILNSDDARERGIDAPPGQTGYILLP